MSSSAGDGCDGRKIYSELNLSSSGGCTRAQPERGLKSVLRRAARTYKFGQPDPSRVRLMSGARRKTSVVLVIGEGNLADASRRQCQSAAGWRNLPPVDLVVSSFGRRRPLKRSAGSAIASPGRIRCGVGATRCTEWTAHTIQTEPNQSDPIRSASVGRQ